MSNDDVVEKTRIVIDFAKKLISESEPLDPEFSKTVDENFWDLI